MKSIYFLLVMGMLLVACGGIAQETATTIPEPTDPPEPTATATEPMETVLPPQPSATNTSQPTPTVVPTDTPPALQINFTPSENNPIVSTWNTGNGIITEHLVTGEKKQTDSGTQLPAMGSPSPNITLTRSSNPTGKPYAESDPVMGPNSSEWDDVDVKCSVMSTDTGWEMVYKGLGTTTDGINSKFGYATSTDGMDWVKYPGNPIYQSNKDLLARNNEFVIEPSILKDGSTYYLYYSYTGRAMEGVATGTITQP